MPTLRDYIEANVPKNPTLEEAVSAYDTLMMRRKELYKKTTNLKKELTDCEEEIDFVNVAIAQVNEKLVDCARERVEK